MSMDGVRGLGVAGKPCPRLVLLALGMCMPWMVGVSSAAASASQPFGYSGSAVTFTVPTGVSQVTITAAGAQGGAGGPGGPGGKGAQVQATFSVSPTEILNVVVGGHGSSDGSGGGGGGGSFVYTSATTSGLLMAAAGGGGGGVVAGSDGSATTAASPGATAGITCLGGAAGTGGDGGNFGVGCNPEGGGGGGGLLTDGGTLSGGGAGGQALTSGAAGGVESGGGDGGFGGGGAAGNNGGGGGGYNGGGGGGAGGGGGGSFFASSATNASGTSGANSGDGQVLISYTATSTTTVGSSQNPSQSGQSVTFTATVAGASPTGTVDFKDGSGDISGCSAQPLSGMSAACTTSALSAGSHSITAVYSGDAGNTPGTSSTLTQTVQAPPSAVISTPSSGGTYARGQSVPTGFSCAEGTGGPGLLSCTDSNGATGGSGQLDTTTLGPHTYTVTAKSSDGQTKAQSISYTVAGAPSVSIKSPANGATFIQGQSVKVAYSCAEGASGPGIKSCVGPVPNGQELDTSTLGTHRFTVTATSIDSQSMARTVSYRVKLPNNRFTVGSLKFRHKNSQLCGRVTFMVKLPGPGVIDVLETAWKDNFLAGAARLLNPAPGRFVFAREHVTVTKAGKITLTVLPSARGRWLLIHHRYPVVVRLWVSFIPAGGNQRDIGFYGLHLTPRRGQPGPACLATGTPHH